MRRVWCVNVLRELRVSVACCPHLIVLCSMQILQNMSSVEYDAVKLYPFEYITRTPKRRKVYSLAL